MPEIEIKDAWQSILSSLIRGSVAWQSPVELAGRLGRDVDAVTDELASMHVAGWLSVWERPDGIVVTLSSWGAERLGVRLGNFSEDQPPRWTEIGAPEPPSPKARRVAAGAAIEELDLVFDPLPSPDLAVEVAEDISRNVLGGRSKLMISACPTLLIGERLTPWPGPALLAKRCCPACHGQPLNAIAYCLYCDRWGLEHLLLSGSGSERLARPDRPRISGQEAARLRNRRKARRRSRFSTCCRSTPSHRNPRARPCESQKLSRDRTHAGQESRSPHLAGPKGAL